MANFGDQYSQAISEKMIEIMKDAKLIENAVRRDATSVVSGRVVKRFFADAYAIGYSQADLARRPFLNIGPGSFRHDLWRTADKKYDGNASWTEVRRGVKQIQVDYDWDIYSGKPMTEKDSFFKVIYSSHVIEHLFPQDVIFFVGEIKRLLEPGGIVRIVCPDAEQMATAYKSKDWPFFMSYLIAKTGRYPQPLSSFQEAALNETSAAFLLEYISLLTNKKNPTFLSPRECVHFLAKYEDIYEAFDEACRLSSREVNSTEGGHVTWYTAKKLETIFKVAGFSKVQVSGFQKSAVAVLRDGRYFDRTDPEMSIFVEATK